MGQINSPMNPSHNLAALRVFSLPSKNIQSNKTSDEGYGGAPWRGKSTYHHCKLQGVMKIGNLSTKIWHKSQLTATKVTLSYNYVFGIRKL